MSKKIGNFAYWTDFISNYIQYGHCRAWVYEGKQVLRNKYLHHSETSKIRSSKK